MSEIKHWLDETSEADAFERAILRRGSVSDPSETQRAEVWDNVLGVLAIAPAVGGAVSTASAAQAASSGAAKAAVVGLGVCKGLIIGLALYGAVSGITQIVHRGRGGQAARVTVRATRHASPGVAMPTTLPAAPLATVERLKPEPAATVARSLPPKTPASAAAPAKGGHAAAGALASVAAFEPPAVTGAIRASQLKAEAAALSRARDALRVGRLIDAFAQLEALRREFPAPELYQEREALSIELLARSGQVEAAKQRAEAFLERFPESPHADQVQRFARPPR